MDHNLISINLQRIVEEEEEEKDETSPTIQGAVSELTNVRPRSIATTAEIWHEPDTEPLMEDGEQYREEMVDLYVDEHFSLRNFMDTMHGRCDF